MCNSTWVYKNELKNYSKELLNKKEIIVLNKVDLLEKKIVEKIRKNFSKNKKSEVMVLSTHEKKSVIKIKKKEVQKVKDARAAKKDA